MCVHTPADNMVTNFLYETIDREKPQTVADVLEMLQAIPEYRMARKINAGPRILAGKKENTAGKIYVDFTGGTSGATEMMQKLTDAGVSTIVCMHMGEKHLEAAKKAYLNVILAGHMSSDSIGLNLFLDQIEKNGVQIIPVSGVLRVKRN